MPQGNGTVYFNRAINTVNEPYVLVYSKKSGKSYPSFDLSKALATFTRGSSYLPWHELLRVAPNGVLAKVEGFEPSSYGFGDRYFTIKLHQYINDL